MSEKSENGNSMNNNNDCSKATLYQALMAHTIHQDSLLWGRVGVLIAIQGAVLIAGYKLKPGWAAMAVMIFGALLTFCVYLLVLMCNRDKKVNWILMDKIAEDLVSGSLAQRTDLPDKEDLYVRFSSDEPKWRNCFPAYFLLKGVLILFIIVDIALAAVYLFNVLPRGTFE